MHEKTARKRQGVRPPRQGGAAEGSCGCGLQGFSIPDEFVVGYGLDYAGKWRNLPSVHVVEVTGESRTEV